MDSFHCRWRTARKRLFTWVAQRHPSWSVAATVSLFSAGYSFPQVMPESPASTRITLLQMIVGWHEIDCSPLRLTPNVISLHPYAVTGPGSCFTKKPSLVFQKVFLKRDISIFFKLWSAVWFSAGDSNSTAFSSSSSSEGLVSPDARKGGYSVQPASQPARQSRPVTQWQWAWSKGFQLDHAFHCSSSLLQPLSMVPKASVACGISRAASQPAFTANPHTQLTACPSTSTSNRRVKVKGSSRDRFPFPQ